MSREMCGHHVLNVFTYAASEMYDNLKSFQNTTSFQPESSLSFIYFFGFLLRLVPKIKQPIWYKLIIY
jgi:hypothetical protein